MSCSFSEVVYKHVSVNSALVHYLLLFSTFPATYEIRINKLTSAGSIKICDA